MATNTSNRTYNPTDEEFYCLPTSQCLPLIVVMGVECLAIVIFNVITIIVFLRQRQLRRQSLYLVIHLAIVDLLVGGISGPLSVGGMVTYCCVCMDHCNVWGPFSLFTPIGFALSNAFPGASIINLVAISLERLHATFRPFKHRFLKKWVYYVIITVIWSMVVIRGIIQIVLKETIESGPKFVVTDTMLVASVVIFLFILCLSYIAIYIKVKFSRHPNFLYNSVMNRERRLTSTLFIALVTSLLTLLPWGIVMTVDILMNTGLIAYFTPMLYIWLVTSLLVLANSLANPIIYAMRMPEFRTGLAVIFHRNPNHVNSADLPLRRI